MTRASLLLAALLLAGPAMAAELTNREATPQLVFVTEEADGSTQELRLAPGQTVAQLCADGCTLGLDNDEAINLEGPEKVELKGGIFRIVQ